MARNPEVNFYLKPEGADKLCLIYLNFKYNNQKLHYSFGEKISKKNWDKSKQKGRNVSALAKDGEHSLNELLDNLKRTLEEAYKKEKVNGIPTPNQLRAHLDAFRNQNTTKAKQDEKNNFFTLLDRFINGEIPTKKGVGLKPSSLKSYCTAKTHLENFQKDTKYKVSFETITEDFFDRFVTYLSKDRKHKYSTNLGIKQSSIKKTISIVKVVMGKALALRYSRNDDFKRFSIEAPSAEDTYLSIDELVKLYKYDFTNKPKLEKVRDTFVFGCFVGLRFGDFTSINPENITREKDGSIFLHLIQGKTEQKVIIPCHPLVLEIFDKYSHMPNRLPPMISNQKFNKYIKEACKEAGMTEKGRIISEPDQELWSCITAHTCRRSFATNWYLKGFPIVELMRITGHKSESTFLKYIKVGVKESATKLGKLMHTTWQEFQKGEELQ